VTWLEHFDALGQGLGQYLTRVRHSLRERPAGVVADAIRENLLRLAQRSTVMEEEISRLNLAEALKPERSQTQDAQFFWLRVFPLTVLAIILTPLLLAGVPLRRVAHLNVTQSPAHAMLYLAITEIIALTFAFTTERVFRKLEVLMWRWSPLRSAGCELSRLAMPDPRGRAAYSYLEPPDLATLYQRVSHISAGLRFIGIFLMGSTISLCLITLHASWRLWWYPCLLLLLAHLGAFAAWTEAYDVVQGVARCLRIRIKAVHGQKP